MVHTEPHRHVTIGEGMGDFPPSIPIVSPWSKYLKEKSDADIVDKHLNNVEGVWWRVVLLLPSS